MAGQDKLSCGLCGSPQSHVVRVLEVTDIRILGRQRRCEGCGTLWLTEERPVRILKRGPSVVSTTVIRITS
jgi:transcriptional regulator NrdR family protein